MIHYRSEEEIDLLRESSLLVGKTLAEVAKHLKPGVRTIDLDKIAEEFIRDHQAIPGFKDYRGYPGTLCVSINDQVVHGIPGERIINEGDIVSIDCGVLKDSYYGDSAYTFAVAVEDEDKIELLEITKEALYKGISMAVAGNRIGDVGFIIQNHVEKYGFSAVRDLVGHGIGKEMHEDPQVPNYGKRDFGVKLKEGMVICIEPMINLGKKEVVQENDGWTIRTIDGKPSAHFEHEIVVRKGKAEILSSFKLIEEVLNLQKN